jgi:RimJ/RimL family protein N-acetyltransferase
MSIATVPMHVAPVTLEGDIVRLEPLALRHVDDLARVALDPDLWRWVPNAVTTREDLEAYVDKALEEYQAGSALPFAVIERASGRAIGSTRYAAIERAHRRLEIGWTWYGVAWHRTGVNTESKLLLLTHAFEELGAVRVELKTDALNERSRSAILRLGAQQEGILRNHMVIADSGRIRDTVYFSIIEREWPQVKARLQGFLARSR